MSDIVNPVVIETTGLKRMLRLLPTFYVFILAGCITMTAVVWYILLLYLGMFETTVYEQNAKASSAALYFTLSRELD